MSGDKLKSLGRNVQLSYVVCSLDSGVNFPADEIMLVKRFETGSHGNAVNWIIDNQDNHTALTILEVYV